MNLPETKQSDLAEVVSGAADERGTEPASDLAEPNAPEAAAPSPGGPASTTSTREDEDPRHGLAALTLACAAGALIWIVAVAQMTGRGFDTSDEGYYLLSYRWWNVSFRNFTGAQYMYGPVFQALGFSISKLRYFRLFTVVATHAVLGYTFMRWLRLRRPNAPKTPLWEAAGVAAIVAAAATEYGWLPLSPGYNDVSLLGGFLAAAVALRVATYVDRGLSVPRWVPLAFGPVVFGSLFAKWSSATVSLAVVGGTLVVVLAPRGIREIARFTAWTLASVVATVAFVHVFVVRLGTAIPPMIEINRTAASHTNSVGTLLSMYWTTGSDLMSRIAHRHAVIVLAAAIAVVGRRKWLQTASTILAAGGLAYAYSELDAHHGTTGGAPGTIEYPSGLLAGIVVALVIALVVLVAERVARARGRGGKTSDAPASSITRDGFRGFAVLAMLSLSPITQAMGTGNPLYFTAINGFAAWMTLIIAVYTGIEGAPAAARWILGMCATAITVLAVSVGVSGVKTFPYRASSYELSTTRARGVPALASVKLSPTDAAGYARLHDLLEPYVVPTGRAIMGFDEMAGIVFLLDGRPVGEAWYSASDLLRTADGIRSVCQGGHPFWGERAPLLVFRRQVAFSDVEALRSCGLSFATDYRMIAPMHETMGLAVYVPVSEATKGSK